MSDQPEPSPRPWRVADYPQCPGLADIFDASGSPSGLVAGELKPADAALICDAVNTYAIKSPCRVCSGYAQKGGCIADERDRLRDIVRRLLMLRRGDIAVPLDMEKQIIADARAAIGEDKP